MLHHTNDLEHYSLRATDGLIGKIKDLYFDDDAWVVRYLVVETGTWLASRRVLVSPMSVHRPDWVHHTLPVSLTQEQVRRSPDIDTDKPVSRQHEEALLDHYGYPGYWGGTGLWGAGHSPYTMLPASATEAVDGPEHPRTPARIEQRRRPNDDPHLRSCNTVVSFRILARDGEIGHVSGFLVDDETWTIRYLVIDTSNWWGSPMALVAPPWIEGVHWENQTVSVGLARDAIKDAPPYDPGLPCSREQESTLYRHYRRDGYWTGATAAASRAP